MQVDNLLLDLDNDAAEDEAEVEREGEKRPLIDPRRVVRYSFADTIRGKPKGVSLRFLPTFLGGGSCFLWTKYQRGS
jgi:hypothetical protein